MSAASDLVDKKVRDTKVDSIGRAIVSHLPGGKSFAYNIPSAKTWWLLNTDTTEFLFGPYELSSLNESVSTSYSNTFALNRQKAITEFLHGNVETFSMTARFYTAHVFQRVVDKVDQLKNWTRRSEELGRPPILYFWVGDQHAKMTSCVITSVSVDYDPPGFMGLMRGATVNINLQKYDPFSLEDVGLRDTRYHQFKVGDTFEMLAAREYGDPMLGVVLRQRHRAKKDPKVGSIIKLQNINGSLRTAKAEPKSLALRGVNNRRSNPQKVALKSVLNRRKKAKNQFIVR